MTSCSSYTYRDHAIEYESTEDYNLWDCEKLDNSYAIEHFNHASLRISLSDQKRPSTLLTPRSFAMEQSDDFIMEPMLTLPSSCSNSIDKLLGGITTEPDSMCVCAAMYGNKNIVFKLSNCILCVSDTNTGIYVPTSFIRKIKEDLSFRDMQCSSPGLRKTLPFYNIIPTSNVISQSQCISTGSKKRRVTTDHEPMFSDGFTHYSMIEACVYVTIVPRRSVEESDYGNGPITFHGRRQIKIYAMSISKQQSKSRNSVAVFTTDGYDSAISQRSA